MYLNKLIEIFKDLEVSTKNIREFLKSDDYFANYNNYQELTEIVKSTNYGLLEIDGRLAELNLTPEEIQAYSSIKKVLLAFKNNHVLRYPNGLLEQIRNAHVTKSIIEKLEEKQKLYQSKYQKYTKIVDDCDTLTKIITELQKLTSNDYINPDLMTLISNFLENKEEYNQDQEQVFKRNNRIYKLIMEQNIEAYNAELKQVMNERTHRTYNKVQTELITKDELLKVFIQYGYDITNLNNEVINEFKHSISKEDLINNFEFLKKHLSLPTTMDSKTLTILCGCNGEIINYLEDFSNKYGISIIKLMQVTPNIFISKRNSIKSNLEKDSIPIQSAFKDFVPNVNLIESLGYNIYDSYSTCPSVFTYPHSTLKNNAQSLEVYGIKKDKLAKNFKLSGLKSTEILSTIDAFIEVGELDYLLSNTSRLCISYDSPMLYRLYHVKKHNALNPYDKIEYKSKRNPNNLSNIISNLEDNTLGINSTNALERTNTIIPQVFDVDTTKEIEDKIKENNVTYDFTKINNPYITYLEQNNKASNNAYNICGVIVSRFKVLRLYASLSNMIPSTDKLLLFCITYHSKITAQEFANMKEYVESIVNEPLIGGRK